MTRIFKKVQRDKNEEVFEVFGESNLPSQEITKENVIHLLYRTHTHTKTHAYAQKPPRVLLLKMTTTTTTTSFSSSSSLVSSIRENNKIKYSNKKIGIPKTRKRPPTGRNESRDDGFRVRLRRRVFHRQKTVRDSRTDVERRRTDLAKKRGENHRIR